MEKPSLKSFQYVYKKLFPIREIDSETKKKLQTIIKSFEGIEATNLLQKIFIEQLSYFFNLFFLSDFEKTIEIYNENRKTNEAACVKRFTYLLEKIHRYVKICEENIELINGSDSYKIIIQQRINGLLFYYTTGFEDLIYLYYSFYYKLFILLYNFHTSEYKNIKKNDCELTEEECVLMIIPELNNFKVCIGTWDKSQFYSEYINEAEEEGDDNYNYNEMDVISEEDQSINGDSSKGFLSSSKVDMEDEVEIIKLNEELEETKEDVSLNENVEMDDCIMEEEKSIDEEMNKEDEDELNTSSDEGDAESIESSDIDEWISEISDDFDIDFDEKNYKIFEDEDKFSEAHNQIKQFVINSSYINDDHFLYRYEYIICNVIYRSISHHINSNVKGNFSSPCLVKSISYFNCVTIPFQKLIWQPEQHPENQKSYISWNSRILFFIYKTYFDLRISELFDIIVEYPDSKWALIDLKISMKKIGFVKELITSLNSSIKKRLLHQGAKTSDIVQQYISLIKCMQILDPSGLLLEQVSDPIKKYLRDREDTIKCIIQIIVDDNNNDLLEGFSKQDINSFNDMNMDDFDNDNWMPELLEVDIANEAVKKKNIDIISTLLNIYDSKDMFIKEFQELLANRLLALKSYDTKRELKNVELLKLRFGESSLQLCEVMVKDISSSRRIDYNIHSNINYTNSNHSIEDKMIEDKNNNDNDNNNLPLRAKILSHLYWPPFKKYNLKFPKEIQKYADIYSKKYSTLKPSRKLQWLPYLGNVSLTVELEDRVLSFDDLTPLQAIILYHFQEKDQWELDVLANELEVTPSLVKRGIVFWINKGIMKEISKNVFKILEKEEEILIDMEEQTQMEEIDEINTIQDSKDQQMEKMRIYWTFISNMVTNLGGMTIERIHQMLQVCLSDYKSQLKQLESFLELMVQENKLELNGDIYTIKK